MEFRHLKYFLVLAEELNFSRAAEKLFISQPPLSRQIQQLEEKLGVKLFIRRSKGIELTEAGKQFRIEAEKIVALTSRSIERTQMVDKGALGRLDIGVFGSAVFNIIPTLLQQFRTDYPEVSISISTLSKTEQIAAIREGSLTIGFNRFYPEAVGIQVERVLSERIMLAVPGDHALATHQKVALKSLAKEQFILFPSKPRPSLADEVLMLCRDSGFTPNVVQETEDVVTSIALVSLGFGVCCVPESTVNLKLPNVAYIPLYSPTPKIDLDCVYRKDIDSTILDAFLAIVRDYGKRNKLSFCKKS